MVETYRAFRYSPASASGRAKGMNCWTEMRASGVLDRTALVFGQMNEPPGARWRVGLTALTIAEYFRDE